MSDIMDRIVIVLNYSSGNVHILNVSRKEDHKIEELLKQEFGKDQIEWMSTRKPDFLHFGWSQ